MDATVVVRQQQQHQWPFDSMIGANLKLKSIADAGKVR
jgi:hypothetical protein